MAKIFRGKDTTLLYSQLKLFFEHVSIAKPASSRNSSIEAFVVCEKFHLPKNYVPQLIDPMRDDVHLIYEDEPVNRTIVPFVVCGDLRGYDSDMSYPLTATSGEAEYVYREVVQKPINPAYAEVIKMTEKVSLKHNAITQVGEEGNL